eukprot:symbB.v1.2.001066.t1/scaffold33.1/size517934/18
MNRGQSTPGGRALGLFVLASILSTRPGNGYSHSALQQRSLLKDKIQLKKLCRERGLRFSGTKAQLAERLSAFDSAQRLLGNNTLEQQSPHDLKLLWSLLCPRKSSKKWDGLEPIGCLKQFLASSQLESETDQPCPKMKARPPQHARARQIGFMMAMANHCCKPVLGSVQLDMSQSERKNAMQLETQLISDSIREIGTRCQMLVDKHRALLDDRKRLEAEA